MKNETLSFYIQSLLAGALIGIMAIMFFILENIEAAFAYWVIMFSSMLTEFRRSKSFQYASSNSSATDRWRLSLLVLFAVADLDEIDRRSATRNQHR